MGASRAVLFAYLIAQVDKHLWTNTYRLLENS